jgi:hypothetical protein
MYYVRRIRQLPLSKVLADGFRIEASWKRGRRLSIMFHDETVWSVRLDQDRDGFIPVYLHHVFRLCCDYLNTPRAELLEFRSPKQWNGACSVLATILPLIDRRVGKFQLSSLLFATDDPIVRRIVALRFRKSLCSPISSPSPASITEPTCAA